MADFNYDEYDSGFDGAYPGQPGLMDRARRWVNVAGAVSSVALIVGLAFWGYQLAVRDVTGVPVMRAAAGAMRIAPQDPGGEQAQNQGLTVNAVAAMGTTARPSDTITLAPMPVALQADDKPLAVAAETPVAETRVAETLVAETPVASAAVDEAVAAALTEVNATATNAARTDMAVIVPNDPNALRVSLRPRPRPASLTGRLTPTDVQTVSGSTKVTAISELDPATIPAGTRLAQLGAFEAPELARAQFADLQANMGELMSGKDMVIQAAQSGGRTFYRLRAHGFANDEDARRFCAALQAEGTDCIPVAQR